MGADNLFENNPHTPECICPLCLPKPKSSRFHLVMIRNDLSFEFKIKMLFPRSLCHFYSKAELFFPGFFSDFSQILRIRIRTENNFPHNVSNHISSTQDKIYLHTHHWKISHFSSHFNQMKLFFVSQFLMCSLS